MPLRYLLGALLAAATFATGAVIPATETAEVVEFHNAKLDHYFITLTPKEISDLDTGVHPGWVRTGYKFLAIKPGSAQAGSVPVCRFYGRPEKGIDSHFYSSKASECEDVKTKFPDAWVFETGEAFRAFPVNLDGSCPVDTVAVNRLYNNRPDVNHRYTDQASVYYYMIGKSYTPEGDGSPAFPVAYCTAAGGSVVPPAPPAGAPDCTLAASSASPALGSTLTLTATCTNTPTKFVWAGCTSTTNTCQSTKTAAGTVKYTVYASNAAGPAPELSRTVTWGAVAGNLPICTLTPSATSLTAGTPLTLSANCSQSPNNYDWYQCDYLVQQICNIMPACPASASACTVNATQAGFARYAVAASNTSGLGPRVAADVEWKQGSGGGGGGGGGVEPIPSCSLFASNSTPLINTNVVLSASCSGNPTSYFWTGTTNCSGVQCQVSSAAAGSQTYSVSASNGSGTGGVAFVSVNWQGTAAPTPVCSLTASNPTPVTGTTVTISAFCTNSPTNYAWTGCTANGPNCTDSSAVAGQKAYTLVASNGAGTGNLASVNVQWSGPVTTPPVCSISASSTTPTVGQTIALSASCTGSPTEYVWTNCTTTPTSPTCSATASAAGGATYYVAGKNQFGVGSSAGIVVNWAPTGGGGGGGGALCSAYSGVIIQPIGWGDNSRYLTSSMGGFSSQGVIVLSFTVPSSPASYGTAGNTSIAEYGEPATFRQMTLSESACDFRPLDRSGAAGPLAVNYGNTALIDFNVGAPPASLTPGKTYYMNFRNYSPDIGNSCFTSTCNAAIVTNWPK